MWASSPRPCHAVTRHLHNGRALLTEDACAVWFREKLKRDKGQTGFCKILRFPAVFCENLRLRNAVIPRTSENQQKPAKICEKLRIQLRLSHLICPFNSPWWLRVAVFVMLTCPSSPNIVKETALGLSAIMAFAAEQASLLLVFLG